MAKEDMFSFPDFSDHLTKELELSFLQDFTKIAETNTGAEDLLDEEIEAKAEDMFAPGEVIKIANFIKAKTIDPYEVVYTYSRTYPDPQKEKYIEGAGFFVFKKTPDGQKTCVVGSWTDDTIGGVKALRTTLPTASVSFSTTEVGLIGVSSMIPVMKTPNAFNLNALQKSLSNIQLHAPQRTK